jgi:hypothetical protein
MAAWPRHDGRRRPGWRPAGAATRRTATLVAPQSRRDDDDDPHHGETVDNIMVLHHSLTGRHERAPLDGARTFGSTAFTSSCRRHDARARSADEAERREREKRWRGPRPVSLEQYGDELRGCDEATIAALAQVERDVWRLGCEQRRAQTNDFVQRIASSSAAAKKIHSGHACDDDAARPGEDDSWMDDLFDDDFSGTSVYRTVAAHDSVAVARGGARVGGNRTAAAARDHGPSPFGGWAHAAARTRRGVQRGKLQRRDSARTAASGGGGSGRCGVWEAKAARQQQQQAWGASEDGWALMAEVAERADVAALAVQLEVQQTKRRQLEERLDAGCELERRLDQSLTQGAPYVARLGWNDMLPFYDYWA